MPVPLRRFAPDERSLRAGLTRSFRWLLAIVVFLATAPAPQAASIRDTEACEVWAAVAAAEFGVPERLMLAITRVETGRGGASGTPWPWAVNAGGRGHWFPTLKDAADFARQAQDAGEPQIDIGCFQLNTRWHGRAFASPAAMFDPGRNARYAARFLAALHDEFGSWTEAAAAYHSRTPALGRAYVARLQVALAGLPPFEARASAPDPNPPLIALGGGTGFVASTAAPHGQPTRGGVGLGVFRRAER